MVESRSVIRNAKNAQGLGRERERAPPPFPSCARLNFAFNKFPLRILSESLAQAKVNIDKHLKKKFENAIQGEIAIV